jgi:hypothetical protein
LNGDSIGNYLPQTNQLPYVQNWNFGVQYELPWQTKLEANYIGNKGTRLSEPQYVNSLNQVDPKYLSLGVALLDPISAHPEARQAHTPGFPRGCKLRASYGRAQSLQSNASLQSRYLRRRSDKIREDLRQGERST